MRAVLAPAVLAFASVFAGNVVAGPAYTAEDIINHFAAKQATRAVCVGTQTDCQAGEEAQRTAETPFDLLVTFDLNSAALTDEAKQNLDRFVEALRSPQLATMTFDINGHTDARGPESYNLTLSQRRAAAVVEYLSAQGVDTAKLVAKGFGKTHPRSTDPYAAENRRVEATVQLQ